MLVTLLTTTKNNLNLLQTYAHHSPHTILTLRKARLFVKSRYSRNRQWSKSIVYFGLWFNIISVIWTIYYCYRYVFIFSHLFWLGVAAVVVAGARFSRYVSLSQLSRWAKTFVSAQ